MSLMARGRRIPHTHIFLVPTVRGDVLDRYFNGLESVQEASEELEPLENDRLDDRSAIALAEDAETEVGVAVVGRQAAARGGGRPADLVTPGAAAAGAAPVRGDSRGGR